jgi:5-methylcytosine-specific restriction endonuclease McrA
MAAAKPKCPICKKVGRNKTLPLVNGKVIHQTCYDTHLSSISDSEIQINQARIEISSARATITENSGFFKTIFGGSGREALIAEQKNKIASLEREIPEIETEIASAQTKLEAFYDYWPEYPPDWEDRRYGAVRDSNQSCAECGLGGRELHVHHIKPIAKGGSHLPDNLEVLCEHCHKKHHHWLGKDKGNSKPRKSAYRQRLEMIHKAIGEKRKLKFHYQNYEGEKTSRTVRIDRLVQPGEGYADGSGIVKNLCVRGFCELRKEKRSFTISKMRDLKLV